MTADEDLVVTSAVRIPAGELSWRFTGSGGPGGQHANTANTKVELRFDVAGSGSLPEGAKARLVARVGPEVRVVVSDERSQARNREIARERMRATLADALRVPKRRVPTRPGRGATARRVATKQRRGELKRLRRRVDPSD